RGAEKVAAGLAGSGDDQVRVLRHDIPPWGCGASWVGVVAMPLVADAGSSGAQASGAKVEFDRGLPAGCLGGGVREGVGAANMGDLADLVAKFGVVMHCPQVSKRGAAHVASSDLAVVP